jgi:CubicO group peptidase (beta-lactamase class C family)
VSSFAKAKAVLSQALEAGEIPSAVAIVGTPEQRELVLAKGVERYGGKAVTAATCYDIASLTKVVATLPLILELVSKKELSLEDTLGKFFSNAGWMQHPSVSEVRLHDLLTHSSGLPAWKPLFAWVSERTTAIANVVQTPLEQPGKFVYSDLGFMLLGAVLERVTGKRQDILAAELFRSLEMQHTSYGPLINSEHSIAATEDCGWRGRVLVGEVHDENAFVMEGVAGHAGLFATAEDLARYAQAWLHWDSRLASEDVLREATRLHLEQNGTRRGLGWMLKGEHSFAGSRSSLQGYGHTGFTGTSLWLEPGSVSQSSTSQQAWFAVQPTVFIQHASTDKTFTNLDKSFMTLLLRRLYELASAQCFRCHVWHVFRWDRRGVGETRVANKHLAVGSSRARKYALSSSVTRTFAVSHQTRII